MKTILTLAITALVLNGCAKKAEPEHDAQSYYDPAGRDDVLSGGVKMVAIDTPKGPFHVWTKRTGNNPRIKVLRPRVHS
jgi:proline iminopeptidase